MPVRGGVQVTDRSLRGGRLRVPILLVVLALAIGLLAWTVRERLGIGRDVVPVALAACERMPAPAGPEDLEIDETLRVAFISAQPRRESGAEGGLYLLALDDPDAQVVPIAHDGPSLHPHGLSLIRVGGELYLHVINHADPGGSTVEQFRWNADRLEHLATVSDPALRSPNDVAAVDASRFYVSNDHGGRSGFVRTFEHLLGLRLGDVQYFDGERFHTAVDRQSFANGVLLTRDGRRLLVAETVAGTVTSYLRDPDSGDLIGESYMTFETGPDNLSQAADGSIWMVGHPRLADFIAHAGNPELRSATDVYRIDFFGLTADSRAVLVDDGELISGGSTAVVRGQQMWVGNVFDGYLLRCTLPQGLGSPIPPPAIEPQLSFH